MVSSPLKDAIRAALQDRWMTVAGLRAALTTAGLRFNPKSVGPALSLMVFLGELERRWAGPAPAKGGRPREYRVKPPAPPAPAPV